MKALLSRFASPRGGLALIGFAIAVVMATMNYPHPASLRTNVAWLALAFLTALVTIGILSIARRIPDHRHQVIFGSGIVALTAASLLYLFYWAALEIRDIIPILCGTVGA